MELMKKKSKTEKAGPDPTGIPAQMKQRFETQSGLSFDDVRVHYSSDKPAKLGALAYTLGNQVYVGPGQERYLSHELGHVIQQKRGLVRPTGFLRGMPINTDPRLEREADQITTLGTRAVSTGGGAVQRALMPGIGVELETSDVYFSPIQPLPPELVKETYWKGKKLLDFSPAAERTVPTPIETAAPQASKETVSKDASQPSPPGLPLYQAGEHLQPASKLGNWALTLDTTKFHEDSIHQFSAEIVIDGTKTRLRRGENALLQIGKEIVGTLCSPPWNSPCRFKVGDQILEMHGGFSPATKLSIQLTCAIPMETVLYMLYTRDALNQRPLTPCPYTVKKYIDKKTGAEVDPFQYAAGIKDEKAKDRFFKNGQDEEVALTEVFMPLKKDEAEREAFLQLLFTMFRSNPDDPKQLMPIIPRTSMGKIFSSFPIDRQKLLLDTLDNRLTYESGLTHVGTKNSIAFQDYHAYLSSLYASNCAKEQKGKPDEEGKGKPEEVHAVTSADDPIANHPEPLGIGKLFDAMESDLDGQGEYPIFELRNIGSFSLGEIPKVLDALSKKLIAKLA